jgi:hypothetical protein
LRPFARRRLSTKRPFLVLIRTRKPCVRFRCRVFGWKVRFPFIVCSSASYESTRTLNVTGPFGECQSAQDCVRVCVLLRSWRSWEPQPPCAFGLSPKFSTPVEKTVENRRESFRQRCLGPDCRTFCLRRSSESRQSATFDGWLVAASAKWTRDPWRKLTEADFCSTNEFLG